MYKYWFQKVSLEPSTVKIAYTSHKPSIFSGAARFRHKIMGDTLNLIFDPEKIKELQNRAQLNLFEWKKKCEPAPKLLTVLQNDWGNATLQATQKYATTYTVLNMANSIFPGGAALEGGSAQEENIWHRTSCALTLLDKMVYFDKDLKLFLYNDTATKLLDAKIKMTDEESKAIEAIDYEPYKVFLNHDPSVCFRGPEEMLITSGFEDFASQRRIPDPSRSYAHLPQSDIFPFFELRSAAPDRSSEPQEMNSEEKELYINDLRRRIAAQLDTLILAEKRHVILGAWGCGEFKNDANIVAQIYAEEIEKRAQSFDHIVFPIINTGAQDNYGIFEQKLDGMKLGSTPSLDISSSARS